MKKREASAKDRALIAKLIRAGKVRSMGPLSIIRPGSLARQEKGLEETKFRYVKLSSTWPRWRSKKDRYSGNNGGFQLQWAAEGVGFGEFDFFLDKKNRFTIRTETMSNRFIKAALSALVDSAIRKD